MSGLEELNKARRRVDELRERGTDRFTREMRAAMNRFMSLIRRATPTDMAAFEAWQREQQAADRGRQAI